MNHDDYFEHVKGIVGDMTRLQITVDRITEATNMLPDYIIVPTSWGLTGPSIMDIPVVRADVPDLVAGYLGAPKHLPGPHTGTQIAVEEAQGQPVASPSRFMDTGEGLTIERKS